MGFLETVEEAKAFLERNGRVSLRALRRQFDLDDDGCEELAEELVDFQGVAARDERSLTWTGPGPAVRVADTGEVPDSAVEAVEEPGPSESEGAGADGGGDDAGESGDVGAERRYLTALFCDLVESTPLASGMDPEDYRELMRRYQDAAGTVVERFGGHVAHVLGDGLIVYFGYPTAHEDDAERAVRAGLGIIDALAVENEALEALHGVRLAVRVGIHTGMVVIGEMGGESSGEMLATGDAMHVAARLEGIAEPDTVAMSEATLRLVPGVFSIEDLGERSLKGVPGSTRVVRPLQAAGVRSRLDATAAHELTPFVGREQELGLLEDRFAQVAERRGQAVLICGEAGIGKSRLVQAFREHLVDRPHTWLECQGSPFAQDSALYPVLELQRYGLGFTPDDSPDAKLDALESGLTGVGFDPAATMPLMAHLHGLALPEHHEPLGLSPAGLRARTLTLLGDWVLRLSRDQPLVLFMEDLHWMDPSTIEVIGLVLEQIPTEPVLVVATFRPDFESPWGAHSHLTPMLLSRFTQAQLAGLVRNAAKHRDLPDVWVEEILRRADGVPLFAEELTRAVVETHPELPDDDTTPALEIPDTLQESLLARLDALGPVKEIAQLASVLGREFSYGLLLQAAPIDHDELRPLLDAAVREELFYKRGRPPDATYLFKHALLRDAAYESMLHATRHRHHHHIAHTLRDRDPHIAVTQPELVAHHLTHAGDTDHAITWWDRAGRRELERGNYREAVNHLQRAVDLLTQLPHNDQRDTRELPLQNTLGNALGAAEGYSSPKMGAAFLRAHALLSPTSDHRQLATCLHGLVGHYLTTANFAATTRYASELEALGQRESSSVYQCGALHALGIIDYFCADLDQARRHLERCVALHDPAHSATAVELFDLETGITGSSYLAWTLWAQGYPDDAMAHADHAIAAARQCGHPLSRAQEASLASGLAYMRRDTPTMLELAQEAAAVSEAHAIPLFEGIGQLMSAWCRRGDKEALDEARAGVELAAGTGVQTAVPQILGVVAQVAAAAGELDEATAIIDMALDISADTGIVIWDAELHRLRGELYLSTADRTDDDAEAEFQQALTIARTQHARSLELRAATSLARLWTAHNRRDEARELLAPVYDWFTQGLDTPDLLDAKALLDDLP